MALPAGVAHVALTDDRPQRATRSNVTQGQSDRTCGHPEVGDVLVEVWGARRFRFTSPARVMRQPWPH